MTKIFSLTLLFGLLSCEAQTSMKALHFNIKELASTKINDTNPQLKKAKEIIKKYDVDLLFLNEIQYDTDGAPNSNYQTNGENLNKLNKIFGLNFKYISFYPANTGKNAQRNSNGEFYADPNIPGARDLADQVNFGTIPHQYSSGIITRYPIISEKVITNIEWKGFNPNIDLTQFTDGNGKALPADMELFDKNFLDVTLDIAGKEIHVIVLHTVPAFHFGNKKSPNYLRNRDQLRFLEWYLTGETDIKVDIAGLDHIKGKAFIAAGDWNVAPDSNNPGAVILNSIFKKTTTWIKPEEMSFTNEGNGYAPGPFRLMLDYMVASKNMTFKNGKIIHPNFDRIELGCGKNTEIKTKENFVLQTYQRDGETCSVLIHQSYIDFKEASDHYPIYGELKF